MSLATDSGGGIGGTVYRFKRGTPLKPHHAEVDEGDPVGHSRCPQVWPR